MVRPFLGLRHKGDKIMKEKVRELVRQQATGGKIACSKALKIANEAGCPPKLVGEVADEEKIKVNACQLGCFE